MRDSGFMPKEPFSFDMIKRNFKLLKKFNLKRRVNKGIFLNRFSKNFQIVKVKAEIDMKISFFFKSFFP